MTSIDSNKITNVEVRNVTDMSTSEAITTNNDQNPNTSVIPKIDEEIDVSSDLFAYNPAKYSSCKEKSIVNILKVGEAGTLECQTEIWNGVCSITLWPENSDADYDELLEELAAAIPETTQWSNRRPEIGDFVFGKRFEGDWVRGYVIRVLPHLKVAMIDEAKVVDVYGLATVEKPLSDMYSYTGLCQLSDPTCRFRIGDVAQYKVIGRTVNGEPDEFDILITAKDFEMKANVKPWIPMPQQLGVLCIDVPNGCEVCVTGYRNHTYMYVRPLNPLGVACYNFIMETVAKCAARSPFLKNPEVAVSTLALSLDGNYYRGCIMRIEGDKAHILYHDLGRREYVDTKTLKEYPPCLEKLGYCISKIYLRDIPKDIPPYVPIIKILDNLVENKVPLICWYDGLPNEEGVYLKYPDGETVNNMICNTLVPLAKKARSERSENIENESQS